MTHTFRDPTWVVSVKSIRHGQPAPYRDHEHVDELLVETQGPHKKAYHHERIVLQAAVGLCGGYAQDGEGDIASTRLVSFREIARGGNPDTGYMWSHWRYERRTPFFD